MRLSKIVSDTAWKRGLKSGNWTAQYRGINLVIRINPRTKLPKAIEFYIGGKLNASAPVACSIEDAKWIAVEAADKQIIQDSAFVQAEYRDRCAPCCICIGRGCGQILLDLDVRSRYYFLRE